MSTQPSPPQKHRRMPLNVNSLHKAEQATGTFNQRLALGITKAVSSMWTAYLFTVLAFIGLFGLLGWLNPFTFLLATWISQQFLQLVFLPILSVGQSVLGRHAELMAEEQYTTTKEIFADAQENNLTLSAIQAEQAAQRTLLEQLIEAKR